MTKLRILRSSQSPYEPLAAASRAGEEFQDAVVPPHRSAGNGEESVRRHYANERALIIDVVTIIAAIGDLLAFFGGLWSTGYIRFGNSTPASQFELQPTIHAGHFVFSLVLYLIIASRMGMYRRGNLLRLRKISIGLLHTAFYWVLLYLALSLAFWTRAEITRVVLVTGSISGGMAVLAWRYLLNFFLRMESVSDRFRRRLLIVGWNKEVDSLAASVSRDAAHPYRLVGCLPSPNGEYRLAPPEQVRQLGGYGQLTQFIRQERIDIVLLGDLDPQTSQIVALSELCEREMVQFKIVPTYFQILLSGLHLETISDVPVLGVARLPLSSMLNRTLKRGIDIVGAMIGLVVSLPLLLLFGLLVYRESPGPIIYRQTRAGRLGRPFTMYKIRSMGMDAERQGARWATAADSRCLAIGAVMRKYNIDEIPQFWNVLCGEMSLVGPRPERPILIEQFKEDVRHYNARHQAKPGMTGWAQIHGLRGDTDLIQRIKFDLYYLENWTAALDFYIMFLTLFRYQNAG
jgi:exopolysaccharide biosynthesis polyprenyl glycosylphosphotransferase